MGQIGDYSLFLNQGDNFSRSFILKTQSGSTETVMNLTGYSALAQIRSKTGALIKQLTVGSGLTIDALNGKITMAIAPTDTALFQPGYHNWELQISMDGNPQTILSGGFEVKQDIAV
jgi:hypothetical protein